MTLFVPVPSPVASYEATGASAWSARRIASHCQRLPAFLRGVGVSLGVFSHDLSPLPVSPRRHPTVLLLPFLVSLSACAPAANPEFLIVKFPGNVVLFLVVAIGCFLAGFGLGLVVALQLLRAANSAASQYHRAEVARILSASSAVHAAVQEVLRAAHARIHELRRLLATLQQGGAR